MIDSGLDESFWGHAVDTACYIRNRLAHRLLPGHITPYEMMHRAKPDVSHLRVFGCSAEIYKQKQFVPKQISAERSVSAIFIGYDKKCLDSCPSYLFYLPKQKKVLTRRDARFNELPAPTVGTTVLTGTRASENTPKHAADPPSSGSYPSSPLEWEPLGSIPKNNKPVPKNSESVSQNRTPEKGTTPHSNSGSGIMDKI